MQASTTLSRTLVAITFVAGWLTFATPTAAQTPTLFSTTEFDETNGRAYGINNIGQVIGYASTEGTNHSFHWLNEVATDLHGTVHFSLDQIFTANYSEAYAISNGGQIVGTARTVIDCGDEMWTISNAFLLRPGVLSDLGTPFPGDALTNFWTFGNPCFAHDSAATDVSNANHVVGWADVDGGGTVHAFLVTPVNGVWFVDADADFVNDIMIDLGTLDNLSVVSSATAVNDNGVVTGYSYISDQNTFNAQSSFHAFRVAPQGGQWFVDANADNVNDLMQDIGTLGGNNSWGRDINNAGQIVGESTTATRNTHAFLWENGTMTDLGTLGGANSSASAINEDGIIVGWAENENGERRAAIWINGEISDLNDMLLAQQKVKSDLMEARDINDDNEIVGWGDESTILKAYLLKVATDAQIAEHESLVEQRNDSGGSSGGSNDDGRSGGSSDLTPIGSEPGTGGTNQVPAQTGSETDGNVVTGGGSGGATGPNFGLCGAGSGFAMTLTLAGLLGLRGATRRRN